MKINRLFYVTLKDYRPAYKYYKHQILNPWLAYGTLNNSNYQPGNNYLDRNIRVLGILKK